MRPYITKPDSRVISAEAPVRDAELEKLILELSSISYISRLLPGCVHRTEQRAQNPAPWGTLLCLGCIQAEEWMSEPHCFTPKFMKTHFFAEDIPPPSSFHQFLVSYYRTDHWVFFVKATVIFN